MATKANVPGSSEWAIPEMYTEVIARLRNVLDRAREAGLREPMAMALATVSPDGCPAVRIVLLRGHDNRGLVFYTNSRSDKGRQLAANPNAALCFYWDPLQEQVRVEGRVEFTSSDESDLYWQQRPRASQLAAVASRQSEYLSDYRLYEEEVSRLEEELAGQPVPRPPHWLGYRLIPRRIEFWISRDARMHERTVYEQQEGGQWRRFEIYP